MTAINNTLYGSQGAWPMTERAFELRQTVASPWDADVWGVIRLPDGRMANIPAFYDGGEVWKIRFTPVMPGHHTIARLILNGESLNDPAEFILDDATLDFEVTGEPATPGFLRVSSSRIQQFVFDDGSPYYPFGQNCAWPAWNEYDAYFEWMRAAGLNWSRVWMCHWGHQNLDWRINQPLEPGVLDLEVARAWDGIVAAAERHEIYFQFVLQHHGQYSTFVNANWHEHPWNAANGGWLNEPADFFTDAQARELTRRKYRYIVARWGYSPAIMAWELFNEVQFTDAYIAPDMIALWKTWQTNGQKVTPELLKQAADILVRLNNSPDTAEFAAGVSLIELPQILKGLEYGWIPYATLDANEQAIAAWHDEMAHEIRSVDPWQHLVTTSSVPADSPIWAHMDYYQYHTYRPDMIEAVRQFDQPVEQFDKPIFYGEVGHHEIKDPARGDGRYMRTMLWASLFSGGAGAAQIWDWLETRRINFQEEFRALSIFIAAADFKNIAYEPGVMEIAATSNSTSTSLSVLCATSPQRTLLWIYDSNSVHAGEPAELKATIDLSEAMPGISGAKWFDTRSGDILRADVAHEMSGAAQIQSPTFCGDVAVILEHRPPHSDHPGMHSANTLNATGAIHP